MIRRYKANILLIRRKTLNNQSILDIFCLQTFTLSVLLITGSYGEAHRNNIIRKRTSIILFIAFVLVDFQSPSGILSNVAYPISQAVLLALWEIIYILLLLISVPVKCICRFVVVLLEHKDVDIGSALHSTQTNVGNIFFNLFIHIYEGIESIFLQNSWFSLFQKTVHLSLLIVLLFDSVWNRIFEYL